MDKQLTTRHDQTAADGFGRYRAQTEGWQGFGDCARVQLVRLPAGAGAGPSDG